MVGQLRKGNLLADRGTLLAIANACVYTAIDSIVQ